MRPVIAVALFGLCMVGVTMSAMADFLPTGVACVACMLLLIRWAP